MTFPIEEKLVIAVSSSALFDLTESNSVFETDGAEAYKEFQNINVDKVLKKGVAFPFIKRFLSINSYFPEIQPVEVVLLSRNSAATGKRVFRSIQRYGLKISRAGFREGKSPYPYIPAFNVSLFLSANSSDVRQAIDKGYPAGLVMPSSVDDFEADKELRIAFDYDGVIIGDESEAIFKGKGLSEFESHEVEKSSIPHNPGVLGDLFKKINQIQKLEDAAIKQNPGYQRILRTAIITARSAPSHERVITTLESWGVNANEIFFLGGMKKERILSVLKPHIFFDDQLNHLEPGESNTPMVHIPFGVANL